jgi:hypothetical protein
MKKRLSYTVVMFCFLYLSGCSSNTPPTLDLPEAMDVSTTRMQSDISVLNDMNVPDLGPAADQAFIPSSNPIPTTVETTLNVDVLEAGQQAQVQCTVLDNQGMVITDAATQVDLRPAAGISFEASDMGWIVTGEMAGDFEVFCTCPSAGLRDTTGRTLKIIPSVPAWIQTHVNPEVVVAGDTVEIECDISDAYGNSIADTDAISIMVSPSSNTQVLSGRSFSTTQSGELSLTCSAGAAQATSAVLVIQPDTPTQITANVVPEKMVYRIGEVISIVYFVGDQFGNAYPNYPVNISSAPVLNGFGPRRYRLEEEGIFQIQVAVPDTEPVLSAQLEVMVDDRGPVVDCDAPAFGSILTAQDGERISLNGSVDDLSGVTAIMVDGTPISFDGGTSFSTSIATTPGLNIVEVEATDGLGQSSRSLCGFFVAPQYEQGSRVVDGTIALDLRQGAIDDGDNGAQINSFGDLVRIATRSEGLGATIDGVLSASPRLIQNQSFTIGTLEYIDYQGGLTIGSPSSNLSLDPQGLRIGLGLPSLAMNVQARGRALFFSCTIDGRITVQNANADSIFRPTMIGDVVTFDTLGTNVTVQNINTNFGGFCGNLVDLALGVAGAFSSILEDTVADALSDLIDGTLAGLLGDAIGGLDFSAFAFNFELEGFDGEVSNLDLTTSLTDVSINNTRLQLALGTQVNGPVRNANQGLGIPRFGPGVLDAYAASNSMSALLDGILLNQVMYGLWRAGFFTISDVGSVSGDESTLNASINLLAPPAVEILPNGTEFRLHFGPASGSLTYADLLTDPVALRFGAILRAGIELQPNGEVVFAPDGLTFETLRLDVADSGLSAELASALEAEIATIVAGLLDEAVSGALPTLPIPEFGLPASLSDFGLDPNISLGIRNPSLELDPQSIIINGGFGE